MSWWWCAGVQGALPCSCAGLRAGCRDAPWRRGFFRWAEETFDADTAEAAIVLRRACDIGMGRGMDLDAVERAVELEQVMSGVCFTMQPEQIQVALRHKETIRDFDLEPDAALSEGPHLPAG